MKASFQLLSRLCLFFAAVLTIEVTRSDEINRDARIQTALTLRILKFVTWPSSAPLNRLGNLHLCTVGKSPVIDALSVQLGLLYNNQPVVVREVASDAALTAFRDCDALYLSVGSARDQMQLLSRLAELPVVTLAEAENFIAMGGVFQFRRLENKYVFDVNLSKARALNIKIASPLLTLAAEVR